MRWISAAGGRRESCTERCGQAWAQDLAPGRIGGPTGFDGAERYQYGPDTPEGRAQNRRVEVILTSTR